MKISNQILYSFIGITVLTQIVFGSVAYWIILNDHANSHVSLIQQMAKIIHNNLSVSDLKINSQTYLEQLHTNFTTDKTILLLNTNNNLYIAGTAANNSSNIYKDITFTERNNPIEQLGEITQIDGMDFHWNTTRLDNKTYLYFLESCDEYQSDSNLGVRLLTTSIIMWVAIWVG